MHLNPQITPQTITEATFYPFERIKKARNDFLLQMKDTVAHWLWHKENYTNLLGNIQ